MSSLVRRIQRSVEREVHYNGRGSKLGVVNPEAKDRLSRTLREGEHLLARLQELDGGQ